MSQKAKVHPFLLPASKAEQPLSRTLTSLQLASRMGSNVQSLNAAPVKSAPRMDGARNRQRSKRASVKSSSSRTMSAAKRTSVNTRSPANRAESSSLSIVYLTPDEGTG